MSINEIGVHARRGRHNIAAACGATTATRSIITAPTKRSKSIEHDGLCSILFLQVLPNYFDE